MSDVEKSLPTSLGRLVRFWRKTFDFSQEELALELNSSTRHISRLENGKVHPSRSVVMRIARYLNLKKRDTANLLIAGGYIPDKQPLDFHSEDYRWLRKVMAMDLEALEPYPAVLTDSKSGILMCNRSWLGLFGPKLDLSKDLRISDYFEIIFDNITLRVSQEQQVTLICGLLLTLQQEAIIRLDGLFDELIEKIEEKYKLPPNWPEIGAKFEPLMSFPVSFEINGKHHEFYHVSNAVTSMGPVENAMESALIMLKLYPKNTSPDIMFQLLEHDMNHPCLYSNEV